MGETCHTLDYSGSWTDIIIRHVILTLQNLQKVKTNALTYWNAYVCHSYMSALFQEMACWHSWPSHSLNQWRLSILIENSFIHNRWILKDSFIHNRWKHCKCVWEKYWIKKKWQSTHSDIIYPKIIICHHCYLRNMMIMFMYIE